MKKLVRPAKGEVIRRLVTAVIVIFSLGALGFPLAICGLAAEPSLSQPSSVSGLSQTAANRFQEKLMELSAPGPGKCGAHKPVVITDAEVNSFIKYDRPPFLPPSVRGVNLHFKPEGIYGAASVNFDELKPSQQLGNQLAARLLASIFTGTQRVTALGAMESGDGTAKLTIKDVRIGNTALSDWLVNWFVQTYLQSEYKIDLSKPFLLPNHVTRIEFVPGKAIFICGTRKQK